MARPRKKRRHQLCDELWNLDAHELARMLDAGGVDGVAQWFGCSRFTVWRATKGKGLRRGRDGKYHFNPPDRDKPDEIGAWVKMVDAMPRRGPSTVLIGNGQEIFGGRRSARPLSLECPHEFERLEFEDRLGLRPPQVIMRCRHCWGVESS